MSLLDLFLKLEQQGIKLQVIENQLKINAPKGTLSPDIVEELKSKKSEIIDFLQASVQKGATYSTIEPAEKKEYYPLSSAQKRLYFIYRLDPESVVYNMQGGMEIRGKIDKKRLDSIFNRIVQRHESFRTSFMTIDEIPVQRIHDDVLCECEEYAGMSLDFIDTHEGLEIINKKVEQFSRPFDLSCPPLLRMGLITLEENRNIWLFDMHHIISDGISGQVFLNEFLTLCIGGELPPIKLSYKDFAEWQMNLGQMNTIKKQEKYWKDHFYGDIPVLELPYDFPRPTVQRYEGECVFANIEIEGVNKIKFLARIADVTRFVVFLSLYYVLLSKLSDHEDIVIGTPVGGRMNPDLEPIIGMFINTLALRNFPHPGKTFLQFMAEVKACTLESFENQDLQFEEIVEMCVQDRDTSRNPIFDTMFTFKGAQTGQGDPKISGYEFFPVFMETKTAKVDLLLDVDESETQYVFRFEFCTALFKKSTITRFMSYFVRLIDSAAKNPDAPISGLEIISQQEKECILTQFNDTAAPFPFDKTIHQLFEEQVERSPHHIALSGISIQAENPGGSGDLSEKVQLTYSCLNDIANRLARELIENGAEPDTIVAIKLERSVEIITCILGILKAGCGYLPIEPGYPQERIDYMIKDSEAALLLATEGVAPLADTEEKRASFKFWVLGFGLKEKGDRQEKVQSAKCKEQSEIRGEEEKKLNLEVVGDRHACPVSEAFQHSNAPPPVFAQASNTHTPRSGLTQITDTDTKNAPANRQGCIPPINSKLKTQNSKLECAPAHTAYIMYTSGSTGKPKGVIVDHRNVVRLVMNTCYIELNPGTCILQTSAPVFDVSTFEIWGALLHGGHLHIVSSDTILDAVLLGEELVRNRVNTLWLTSALFDQLVQQDIELFRGLKWLLAGGDVLSPRNIYRVRDKYKELNIINGYGPTENTTFSTTYRVREDNADAIPIGKPIRNSTAYIIDKSGALQPVGIPGELVVGGEGIARGYLNRPELTAEKFVNVEHILDLSVLSVSSVSSVAKIYRTGDLARWREDGNIEFLGRKDRQVKLRGFRIELGEIQDCLLRHESVRETIVVIKEDKLRGNRDLCAYIVLRSPVEEEELRQFLVKNLPSYMVPSFFVTLEGIPLTPNGKVDIRALPEPGFKDDDLQGQPRNEVEEKLVEIWSDVLGVSSRIGIDTDFFKVGGHSLKASILVSRIYKEFQVKIPLISVFKESTIRRMSDFIAKSQKTVFYDISLSEEKEYYPLSYNQRRLYVLHQMQPLSPAFHMPGVIELDGHEVEPNTIRLVLDALTQRHESFRTAFLTIDDYPFQFVSPLVKISFEYVDLSLLNPEERAERFETQSFRVARTPFDLNHPPLIRSMLVKMELNKYLFIYNIHHIVFDGWSLALMQKEFLALYNGYREGKPVELPSLPVRYRDFATWHNMQMEGSQGQESHQFWKENLAGGVPPLHLPKDNEMENEDTTGAGWMFFIGPSLKDRLKAIAAENNTTLFSVMFSVYNLFLSDISGQETISCSVITAGRDHPSLHSLIGFFVNSIIIKTHIDKNKSYLDFLLQVNSDVIRCFNHQAYPLERVFEESGLQYPEISVSFNMFNVENPSEMTGQEIPEPLFMDRFQDVKFDLEIYLTEMSNGITMSWAYKKKMFLPPTMKYMLERYVKLLDSFTRNPGWSLNNFHHEETKSKPGRFKRQK